MELKQLQYFRAAAKRNSISQAAEALYITQPALSRCIRRLEEEVGTPLFTRTSNGVRLTPAGEAFLEELDQMFLHFERGLNNARLAAQQQHPLLSVVYSFEEFDNGVLEQMHNDFPDVRTSISILPPEQAYRELLAGKRISLSCPGCQTAAASCASICSVRKCCCLWRKIRPCMAGKLSRWKNSMAAPWSVMRWTTTGKPLNRFASSTTLH